MRKYLEGEEYFLATYGDAVTDAPLEDMIERLKEADKVAGFLCVRPTTYSFHTVGMRDGGTVTEIRDVTQADLWINGGFFVLRHDIFDYLNEGDSRRGALRAPDRAGEAAAYKYEGFGEPMDTLKDRDRLETMVESGAPPWQVWDRAGGAEEPIPEAIVWTLARL